MKAIQVRRYGGPEELVEWELGTRTNRQAGTTAYSA